MFRMDLAKELGRTLGELDATMGAHELMLWMAKAQVDDAVQKRQDKFKGMTYAQALDQVRASHRATMRRKHGN